MRSIVLVCVLAACGGSSPPPSSSPARTPAPTTRAPRRITRADMLASLPANTKILFAVDVTKLRGSPIAQRGWALLSELPAAQHLMETMCGMLDDLKYALVAIEDTDGMVTWGWFHGIRRDAKLTCAKAVERVKERQVKVVRHGDYSLETSTKTTTEFLWLDMSTAFYYQHAPGDQPVGEQELRRLLASGGGFTQSNLGTLLDHVDFESGLVVVGNGAATKQPGIGGIAMSVEADEGLRAQVFAQLDNEDRAADVQSRLRGVLAKFIKGHMMESGEARAEGKNIAASLSLSSAQFDWWIDFVIAKAKDRNAPTPPPPSGN